MFKHLLNKLLECLNKDIKVKIEGILYFCDECLEKCDI